MSKLPISPLPTDTVKVGGSDVLIRSLTREQSRQFSDLDDPKSRETFVISCATGCTVDEAAEWLEQVDFPTGTGLITRALQLSGLVPPEDPETAKDPTTGSAATS